MKISRIEGVLLICGMVTYIAVLVVDALKKRDTGDEVKTMSPLKSVLCIAGGLAAIIVGGDLVVDSACDIAAAFGMSEALIGLTIVAAGTSLPELVTSIVAGLLWATLWGRTYSTYCSFSAPPLRLLPSMSHRSFLSTPQSS